MLPKFKQNDYITNGIEICKVLELSTPKHQNYRIYNLEIVNSVYGYGELISTIDKTHTLIKNKQYLEYLYGL